MALDFETTLEKFGEKVMKRHESVKKRASFGLFSAILVSTPKLDGYLQNAWTIEFNNSALGRGTKTVEELDVPDSVSKPIAAKANELKEQLNGMSLSTSLQDIYYTNPLPYAQRIEYEGYSAKAPTGMVRINVANWDKYVKSAVAWAKREVR